MTVLRPPNAIIFDMDGLIFDTEALYQKALFHLAQERGLTAIDTAVVQSTIGLSWEAIRDLLARLVGDRIDPDVLIDDWSSLYHDLAEQHLELKPGVIELLASLESLAIPRAVATGAYRSVAQQHLEVHGLDGFFDAVVVNEDCKRGKPAPDPFLTAADRLGVAPADCWALEDSPNGVISAHSAGMMTIMVPDIIEPDADIVQRCHRVVRSLWEVRDLLTT
jgi:HAD superfamily hydrolase (TIGR01509 family)